jgi:maltose-binding protein MalE
MADTVSKRSSDPFLSQARIHRNFADHTRQRLSQYQNQHENFLEALQGTNLAPGIPHYLAWWDAFQSSLSAHADLHEKMADHLEKSAGNFDELDTEVQEGFAGFGSGS